MDSIFKLQSILLVSVSSCLYMELFIYGAVYIWSIFTGHSRKLLLSASFSPFCALPEGKKMAASLFSLSSCTILFILCHKIYLCCLGVHTSDAFILGI